MAQTRSHPGTAGSRGDCAVLRLRLSGVIRAAWELGGTLHLRHGGLRLSGRDCRRALAAVTEGCREITVRREP